MTQTELHRAIAHVTGEDCETNAARGFSLLDVEPSVSEDDFAVLMIDWDQLQAERNTAVLAPRGVASVA